MIIDFKTIKSITRDEQGHFIMIKRSAHQENITIINIYLMNIIAPKYMKQNLTELKGKTENSRKWKETSIPTFNNG